MKTPVNEHLRSKRFMIVALISFAVSVPTIAAQDFSIGVPSARTSAVGGIHTAYTEDLSSLFHNPAGFVSAPVQFSVAELTLGASGPIFDIANVVVQSFGSDVQTLLGTSAVIDLITGIYAAADIAGPIYFGYIGKGLGFGLFNTTDVTFTASGPLRISAVIGEQVMLSGGYAFRLPIPSPDHAFDIGVLLKGALRGEVQLEKSLLELPSLFSTIGLDTITGEPFRLVTGIGVDVGIRYSFGDVFALGVVGKDLFTPTLTQAYASLAGFLDNSATPTQINGTMPIDLSAGMMLSPRLGRFGRFVNDVMILVDYLDILDFVTHPATATNPILHVGLGLEMTLLQILDIRGGFSQGLFSAGMGIDLTIFRLHIAMFGSELSSEPGGRSVYNAMIGLEFRL